MPRTRRQRTPPQGRGHGPEHDTPKRAKAQYSKAYTKKSNYEIADDLETAESNVRRWIKMPTPRTKRSTRGRKHKIDRDTIHKMINSMQGHYNQRIKPWNSLIEEWKLDISVSTLKRAFAAEGYHKCKACQKGYISPNNQKKREEFGKNHLHWTDEQWHRVLFTDEAHFALNQRKNELVIRNSQERYCNDCVQIQRPHSKTLWSVWGGVGWNVKTPLIFYGGTGKKGGFTQEDYRKFVLEGFVGPAWDAARNLNYQDYILQEDNDSSHGTLTHQNENFRWKMDHQIPLLQPWPPQSPDLSPIENIWRILKQRVKKRKCTSPQELRQAIQEEWDSITQEEINACISNMCDRIIAVVDRKGLHTPY